MKAINLLILLVPLAFVSISASDVAYNTAFGDSHNNNNNNNTGDSRDVTFEATRLLQPTTTMIPTIPTNYVRTAMPTHTLTPTQLPATTNAFVSFRDRVQSRWGRRHAATAEPSPAEPAARSVTKQYAPLFGALMALGLVALVTQKVRQTQRQRRNARRRQRLTVHVPPPPLPVTNVLPQQCEQSQSQSQSPSTTRVVPSARAVATSTKPSRASRIVVPCEDTLTRGNIKNNGSQQQQQQEVSGVRDVRLDSEHVPQTVSLDAKDQMEQMEQGVPRLVD